MVADLAEGRHAVHHVQYDLSQEVCRQVQRADHVHQVCAGSMQWSSKSKMFPNIIPSIFINVKI